MSWTNSPLFMEIYALFLAVRSDSAEVRISMVDTSQLPAGAFMPVVPLLKTYNITSEGNRKLDRTWFYEEYLSQGKLNIPNGAMEIFTLKTMVDQGLYDFFPPFREEQDRQHIYMRVKCLRQIPAEVPTPEEMELAINISEACSSATRFRYMLFAGLLAIKSRNRKINDLADVCHKLRTSKYTQSALRQSLMLTRMGSDLCWFVQPFRGGVD